MNPAERPHLSVIVPAFNGEDRLPASLRDLGEWLDAQPYRSELLLVDDGSRAPAAKVMDEFAARRPGTRVLRQPENRGKGAGVARGMLEATGSFRVFIDADLAYPPGEIAKMLAALERGSDVAIACRVLPESRYLMSPSFFHYLYTRHLMSRVFNLMVRTTLLRDVRDSQAGLKGFTARAAELVFPRLTIPGFGFDVEALFIAQSHGLTVQQVGVFFRYDDEPTTIAFSQSVFRMMADLARVRRNHLAGRYR
ncbi:MAG: glycosyltransferase [Gemmatimonadetes bacterium]|nr:glycosyltransferase [Gemmatimonadota bacterium]